MRRPLLALLALALAAPVAAQDEGMEIVVTAQRREGKYYSERPVVGLKRQADSAVQRIEIASDSREPEMRRREVEAMLMAALDKAAGSGVTLVTGRFELIEVTRGNWKDLFPALARKAADSDEGADDDDDEDDDEDENPVFEDDGDTATLRLMAKVKLAGSAGNAQDRLDRYVAAVPPSGRAQIEGDGPLALTIVNPDQYRDEIVARVSAAAQHTASAFGPDYGVTISGLDKDVAWAQVGNTEVFLYIPYSFIVER